MAELITKYVCGTHRYHDDKLVETPVIVRETAKLWVVKSENNSEAVMDVLGYDTNLRKGDPRLFDTPEEARKAFITKLREKITALKAKTTITERILKEITS